MVLWSRLGSTTSPSSTVSAGRRGRSSSGMRSSGRSSSFRSCAASCGAGGAPRTTRRNGGSATSSPRTAPSGATSCGSSSGAARSSRASSTDRSARKRNDDGTARERRPHADVPASPRRGRDRRTTRRTTALGPVRAVLPETPALTTRAAERCQRDNRFRALGVRLGAGVWEAHPEAVDGDVPDRVTFLSPFDRLIHDRDRTEALFGFHYRLEMFVPKAKRVYGYYVLPILRGTAIIGRIEPVFDRKRGVLRVEGAWAEPGAPADSGPGVRDASTGSPSGSAPGRSRSDGRCRAPGRRRCGGDAVAGGYARGSAAAWPKPGPSGATMARWTSRRAPSTRGRTLIRRRERSPRRSIRPRPLRRMLSASTRDTTTRASRIPPGQRSRSASRRSRTLPTATRSRRGSARRRRSCTCSTPATTSCGQRRLRRHLPDVLAGVRAEGLPLHVRDAGAALVGGVVARRRRAARLDRDADQPAAQPRRHRRGREGDEGRRRATRRRQHLRDPVPPDAARPRRRHRPALDDEVPRRPLRRHRRLRRDERSDDRGAAAFPTEVARGRARPVRCWLVSAA